MGKHNIEKFSLPYEALKFWGRIYHNALYSKIYTFNRPSKIDAPHIFICNHQDALMDAMAVLFSVDRPMVFLARSDIFNNPRVASFLYFLKILPVYRMRDGFDTLKNNDEIFQHTSRVLKSCRSVGIYPEGSHAGLRRLRQLQKGVARIAFQTLEDENCSRSFYLIPTGLDYEHYQKFGTRLVVKFGEPFDVRPYFDLYRQDPAKALNQLRDKMAEEMKKHIRHITSERWYRTIETVTTWSWEWGYQKKLTPQQRHQLTLHLAERLSQQPDNSLQMEQLEKTVIQLSEKLDKHRFCINHIRPNQAFLKNFFMTLIAGLISILGVPAFLLYGWFFLLIKRFANKKIKDPQFRTSIRYGITSVGFILLAIVLNVWIIFVFPWYWYPVAILLSAVSGIIGLKMVTTVVLWWKRLRFSFLHLLGDNDIRSMLDLRKSLFEQIEEIQR